MLLLRVREVISVFVCVSCSRPAVCVCKSGQFDGVLKIVNDYWVRIGRY